MPFNSLICIIFFFLTATFYWSLPGKFRPVLLLLASLTFYYTYVPQYLIVLLLSVIMNYFAGRWIGKSEGERRSFLLTVGIILNVLLLALFKYITPVVDAFTLQTASWHFQNDLLTRDVNNIILPLGISFYTFTNISYLIDVKRRKTAFEKNFLHFANYVTFFPKLIQGPVERTSHFMPQLTVPRVFNYDQVADGLRLMLWGVFKKLVIADRLAFAVDAVFNKPGDWNGPTLVFAAILNSFQIYFDFSAYVDIARGAAKVMGYELLKNFNLPYLSKSIKEFWDKWHITLSTWLRDYLFLPVAFRLSSMMKEKKYIGISSDKIIYAAATLVTFSLAGLWHGSGWNFLIMGVLFAIYLITARLIKKSKIRFYKQTGLYQIKWLYNPLQVMITFALVTFAWIFFRSDGVTNAMNFISGIPYGWNDFLYGHNILQQVTFSGFSYTDLLLILMAMTFVAIVQYYFYTGFVLKKLLASSKINLVLFRWGFYYLILILIIGFGKSESEAFLYMKF